MEFTPVSRTIGTERLVDESIGVFTHSIPMPWLLPGLEPTGMRLEVPSVGVITHRDGEVAAEHLW